MLNISNNKIHTIVNVKGFKASGFIFFKHYYKSFNKFLLAFAIIGLIVLFLPWTQNITSNGIVTTVLPNQRPQTIQSQIPGRIEEWFVQEGDSVKKGAPILRISEVKSDYFDAKLIERTTDQINSKSLSVDAYKNKIIALQNQINALKSEQQLKIKQTQNKLFQVKLKVASDSIDFEASKTNEAIARKQFIRTQTLQKEGLKSQQDVEQKKLKLQATQAKVISQENKFLTSVNLIENTQLELLRIDALYNEKIAKAKSDMFTAKSMEMESKVEVSKLENSNSNYKIRNELLIITAPQDGYINKAIKGGVGETFKEGEPIVNIMPTSYDLAIETYVKPIDLPLIHIGEEVRVQFDGWPAIIFSGWPNVSYGNLWCKSYCY